MSPRPDTRWPPWCACCQAAAADVSPWSRVCLFLVCLTFSSGNVSRPTHLPRHYPLPLRRLVMTFLDSWTGNHTTGIAGILVLADIGLAAGAKLEVNFSDETIGLRGSLLPGPVAHSDLDVCLWILDLYLHNSPPSSNLNWLDFHGGTGEKSHWIRSKLLHIHSESHHQHQQYQVCQTEIHISKHLKHQSTVSQRSCISPTTWSRGYWVGSISTSGFWPGASTPR